MNDRKFSPSCERNKDVILDVLKQYISTDSTVLEIGSGTGQHALHFANYFKSVTWMTSDQPDNHPGIKEWITDSIHANIKGPVSYTAGSSDFPKLDCDLVFTANTLHIMSWSNALSLIQDLGDLKAKALVLIYGPFKYDGQFTTDSNAAFDLSLKKRNPLSGIRDFEQVLSHMQKTKFKIINDHSMPANNQLLVFTKA